MRPIYTKRPRGNETLASTGLHQPGRDQGRPAGAAGERDAVQEDARAVRAHLPHAPLARRGVELVCLSSCLESRREERQNH